MEVEVWYTDCFKFKDHLQKAVVKPRFVWTEETFDRKFDYMAWMANFCPDGWEALKIDGDSCVWAGKGLGTCEYPIWNYDGTDFENLNNLALSNRRVVIRGIPAGFGLQRKAIRDISKMQDRHGDKTVLHVQGMTHFPLMFGMGLKSVGTWVRTDCVMLPTGKPANKLSNRAATQWVRLLGFETIDLESDPKKKVIYNARSTAFAAMYWQKNVDFHPHTGILEPWKGPEFVKLSTPGSRTANSVKMRLHRGKELPTDKIACDRCSLDTTCKYYRAESVCTLPKDGMSDLATYFRSRDVKTVIEGLGEMMTVGAERLSRGIEIEEALEELDPEVSKIFDSLFDKGVKLAKLLDPTLVRPNVGVVVNNAGGQTGILQQGPTAKVLVANIVRELEEQGIPREHITPEIVSRVLGRSDQNSAIDVPPGAQRALPGTPGKW